MRPRDPRPCRRCPRNDGPKRATCFGDRADRIHHGKPMSWETALHFPAVRSCRDTLDRKKPSTSVFGALASSNEIVIVPTDQRTARATDHGDGMFLPISSFVPHRRVGHQSSCLDDRNATRMPARIEAMASAANFPRRINANARSMFVANDEHGHRRPVSQTRSPSSSPTATRVNRRPATDATTQRVLACIASRHYHPHAGTINSPLRSSQ